MDPSRFLISIGVLIAGAIGQGLDASAADMAGREDPATAPDPNNAVWTLTLDRALAGKSLTILLAGKDGAWQRALCAPGVYNNAVHHVDASELKRSGFTLQGPVEVTLNADSWSPRDGKSISCQFMLDAAAEGATIRGTYRGRFGPAEVAGTVSGALQPPAGVPGSATLKLRLEKAVSGWPAHLARAILDLNWLDDKIPAGMIHAEYGWGWHGRVESATIKMTVGSLSGEVLAFVGIRPGGTDLGGEAYTFVLQGTVVGSATAGHFEAQPAGKPSFHGTFTGTIVPGPEPQRASNHSITPPAPKAIEVHVQSSQGPLVTPWKSFAPDPHYHGSWLVAGDLDGDGQAEIVSARNAGQAVTTVSACKLDGTVLWTWGRAGDGGYDLGYDVPLQVKDLDGNGKSEVYLGVRGALVVLDGASGRELRRLPLPQGLAVADCITFANLRGLDRPKDILIKDRYQGLWAYTEDWNPLWAWSPRSRYTCHHPTPMDIDGDGKDEVLAGFSLLGPDGTERWSVDSTLSSFAREHVDSAAVLRKGRRPEDWRLAFTYCTVLAVAMVDGRGRTIWEISGSHFESVAVGRIRADVSGNQMVVGIDKLPPGRSRWWLLDDAGRLLAEFLCTTIRKNVLNRQLRQFRQ
jgi:hypothetical protein